MFMVIVYAPSYQTFIYALRIYRLEDIIVYSPSNSLIEFCESAKIKCEKIVAQQDYSYKGYIKHKTKILELSKTIESSEVFFGFLSFDIWGLYFLFCLRGKNKVRFVNLDPYYPNTSFFANIHSKGYRGILLKKIVFFMVTKIWLAIFEVNKDNMYLGITEEKANKYFISSQKQKVNKLYRNNKLGLMKLFRVQSFKYMLIDTEPIDYKFDEQTLLELSELFEGFKDKIVAKPHPVFTSSSYFNKVSRISKQIPAELLQDKNTIAIGVYSSVLQYLANYQKTISLIELAEIANDDYKKSIYTHFLSDSRILIPKSIDELKQMLNH